MPDPPHIHRPEGFPGQRLVITPPSIVASSEKRPITRDLCISHIGSFSATSNHHVERRKGTAQHILIGCLSGKGHCQLAGRDWSLEAGDLLFLPPHQLHSYGSTPSAPWTIFWIHFRGERATDYLESLEVSATKPLIHTQEMETLNDAFEDTFRHAKHGFSEASMLGMSTGLSRLLGLAKVHERSSGKRPLQSEGRLIRALHTIRNQPEKSWDLHEMAQLAAMSVPHFIELCRQQTGLPPNAYLIRLRLQRAIELLLEGEHNVAETARIVGYDDPFYFSRLFRKHMGISPSEVRQENTSGMS